MFCYILTLWVAVVEIIVSAFAVTVWTLTLSTTVVMSQPLIITLDITDKEMDPKFASNGLAQYFTPVILRKLSLGMHVPYSD